jgi:hypothetical protein
METRSGRIPFPAHVGARSVGLRILFDRPVLWVEVALVGYEARYVDEDHHVRKVQAELTAEIGGLEEGGWAARIVATLNLQDDSGAAHWGHVDYLLFVELGPPDRDPIRDHPILEDPVVEG